MKIELSGPIADLVRRKADLPEDLREMVSYFLAGADELQRTESHVLTLARCKGLLKLEKT